MTSFRTFFRALFVPVLVAPVAVVALSSTSLPAAGAATFPTVSPAAMCGSAALNGPTVAPAGAVVINPASGPRIDAATIANPAGTTFYLLAGTHTLGTTGSPSIYDQVIPKAGDAYIGAPGAILDGQGVNLFAFTQKATGVKIQYLTIQHFNAYRDQGVVNHDGGDGWTVQYNTMTNNQGGAVFVGTNNTLSYNCLTSNGQYGFQGTSTSAVGPNNLVIDHNEISFNNTADWETKVPGCGCTGGGKFWGATNVTMTNNWVHDNKSVGIWADTNDVGFTITGNLIENNDAEGILYEISYNAIIANNTLKGNAIVAGKKFAAVGDPTPMPAIYISESGGDNRVSPNPSAGTIDIHDNNFVNNWAGVSLWENADRFCNSPNNTSGGTCTLGGAATITNCVQPGIATAPLYSDCRWKTQNVKVHSNIFTVDPVAIGCTNTAYCARNAIHSNSGSSPAWSPYMGSSIQQAITYNQGNQFTNNTYNGPWQFTPYDIGHLLNFSTWQTAPYNQDAGSTFGGLGAPAVTFSPPSAAFGLDTVAATSPTQSVTVSNSGSAALTITSAMITGANVADFQVVGNGCVAAPVAPGGSCSLTVSFTPAAAGARSASLRVVDNASSSPQTVALTGTGASQALFTYPRDGQTGVDTVRPLSWSAAPGAQAYAVVIGTSLYGADLFSSGLLPAGQTTYNMPALLTGQTLYATLLTQVNGAWDFQSITFVAAPGASFTYPTNGQLNVNTTAPFTWAPVPGAQGYLLVVGSTLYGADLGISGVLGPAVTSYNMPTLPTGPILFATLFTEVNGSWTRFKVIGFTTAPGAANFTYPVNGQPNVDQSKPFTWSTVPGAQAYLLAIGTTPTTADLFISPVLPASQASFKVPALPTGQVLYGFLFTEANGAWTRYQLIGFVAT